MPSPYSQPDVTVEQYLRTRSAPRVIPQLVTCVVGPARQIITRGLAGTFEATEDFQARLPSLAAGAVVDADSLDVLFQAFDASNKEIGLFRLSSSEYNLLSDGENLYIPGSLAIEYSVLSNRNNNEPNSTTDNDYAVGTADGIWFTDSNTDMLGRGVGVDGNSFVIIVGPGSVAGRYRIVDVIPSGVQVHTVRLLKVDDDNQPELEKDAAILSSALPTGRIVYGYPATHFLGTAAGGSAANNIATPGTGIGVDSILELTSGVFSITGSALSDLQSVATVNLPAETSGDAVWFSPGNPGSSTTLTGKNTPAWVAALSKLQVGDWVRFTGDFEGASTTIRDFEVLAIDVADGEIQIQNRDLTGTGVFAWSTLGDITSIEFLRVVHGRLAAANSAGDYLSGTASGIPFDVEILRAAPGYVELAAALPTLSTLVNTPVQIVRGAPFRTSVAQYDLTTRATEGFSGQILVSYRAQRTDLSLNGAMEIGSAQDIEDLIGTIHPDNPLALMCDMVIRAGGAAASTVFYAVATDGDTLTDYQAALPTLESTELYYLVPATQSKAVVDMLLSHCEGQSLPQNKHERILIASLPMVLTDPIVPTDGQPNPTGTISALTPKRISTANPTDIEWLRVRPGHMVSILSNGVVVEQARVKDVNAALGYADVLTNFQAAPSSGSSTVTFRIETYPRSAYEQAEYWRDQAKAYGSKRLTLVRPGSVELSFTDKTSVPAQDRSVRVDSYYACAALAGVASSLPAQAPLTNVAIPGLRRLFGSNDTYTPDQLNTIAEGGNNILIQANRGTSPASRHQLTTDRTSLETGELSIVKLIDFTAKNFRESLRPYIGKNNINRELLTQLRGTSEAILRGLREAGTLLDGSRLDRLYQDPDQPDGVIIEVSLVVPYPCNRIVVRLYI
jgi:hypothetical protein